MKTNKIIYTSLDGFTTDLAIVRPFSALPESTQERITEFAVTHLSRRTESELKAADELRRSFPMMEEQVFFKIGVCSYFLDFYIPEHNVAVEVDGGIHARKVNRDIARDRAFGSIGIKTIRIRADRVMDGHLLTDFYEGLRIPMKKRRFVCTRKRPANKTRKNTRPAD